MTRTGPVTEVASKERMRFMWFMSYCPAGPPQVFWDGPATRGFDYLDIHQWIKMATLLEAAKFDGVFWADQTGIHDVYKGPDDVYSRDTAIRKAVQFPINDPTYLVPAMASVTENLGFVVSSNIVAHHPYVFARAMTTLDHITKGRIGWNIVSSFQHSAWQNTGQGEVDEHSNRYARAEAYTQVIYRLLEGSWEDDEVIRDYDARIYADPRKVHNIEPVPGMYQHVIGPHVCEPSAQRTPFLFQAGSSEDGRNFAARNGEAIFQAAPNIKAARVFVEDMRRRMAVNGRDAQDALIFQSFHPVIGATEKQARRKDAELLERFDDENLRAFFSSAINLDLGSIDVDKPFGQFETNAVQGHFKQVIESAPNRELTFRDYYMGIYNKRFVGTGEQFADILEEWRDAGVLGANVHLLTGQDDLELFIEEVVPVLQERGLMQSEYEPVHTLREKMYGGKQGPMTNERHPASRYRRRGVVARV